MHWHVQQRPYRMNVGEVGSEKARRDGPAYVGCSSILSSIVPALIAVQIGQNGRRFLFTPGPFVCRGGGTRIITLGNPICRWLGIRKI